MNGHTPGPWEVRKTHENDPTASVFIFSKTALSQPFGQPTRTAEVLGVGEEMESNARLIASSPDILKALEEARSYIISRGNDTVERQKLLEVINGALEKL